MGVLEGAVTRLLDMVGLERKAVEIEPALWNAINGGWGMPTKSGTQVSTDTSLQVTAFYRAMLVIADGIAQLPIEIYKRSGKGIEPAIDHPLYDLLKYQPNLLQDSFQFFRTTLMHAAGAGMGVSYKNVVNDQVRELIPIRPEMCQVELDTLMQRQFWISLEHGPSNRVSEREVFHISGPSWSLRKSLDPSTVGREAIGLSRTLEGSQATLQKNGSRPSGAIETDQKLDKDFITQLREQWQQAFGGEGNTGQTPVLHGGLKWKSVQQNGVDSQHLETRKHQIEEIGRLMGVFTIMLGHAGDQSPTFASADAFFAAHVRYTLMPWIVAVKKAVETQLLTKYERADGYECRIDTSELLRGSLKDRAEYYARGLGTNNSPGWLSQDEVRTDDGWNPMGTPESEKLWQPISMSTEPPKPKKDEELEKDDPTLLPAPDKPETKSAPRTLYVCRKLLNGKELLAWAKKQGFSKPLEADDLHVTVALSYRPIDWMTVGDPWSLNSRGELIVAPGGARLVEPIGKLGAVALLFSCSDLSWRNRAIIEAGASWDFPDYQPHVTITYDGAGVDLANVEPYRGELRFGPELFTEVDENWRKQASGG